MKHDPAKLAALVLLAAMTACQGAAASDAYSDAYREAQASGKLLLVTVGVDGPVLADPAKFVVARLPAGFECPEGGVSKVRTAQLRSFERVVFERGRNAHSNGQTGGFEPENQGIFEVSNLRSAGVRTVRTKLSAHPALSQMGGNGAFVARVARDPCVVSALPARYCTPDGLWALVNLPPGTLTQRTLIWAVRMHPECPKSADGQSDARLMAHAAAHSARQAAANSQFHARQMPCGNATEIVNESWSWNTNVVDAAVDIVNTWGAPPRSSHWPAVVRRHAGYGYDMAKGRNCWYATGIFRN